MANDADVVVIGSGFGGAITAARLAERGYKVIVLERGRRWGTNYPREPTDPWVWDGGSPEQRNGWFDFRIFPHMTVVQGAGVGGGSLVYANISIVANDDTFANGWPPEITPGELAQYYAAAGAMLDVHKVPPAQWPERTKMIQQGAQNIGHADRFRPLELAVTFDDAWSYDLPDPHNLSHSKPFTNAQGQQQGTCVHLGNCDIGCEAKARNTLDLNYIPLAEKHGADVRPLHLVEKIETTADGYRVSFYVIDPDAHTRTAGSLTARLVIIAAGSMGSTELLLKCRDLYGSLPLINQNLGKGWSSNGDFLTPSWHPFRSINPTRGPTITAAIDLLNGTIGGHDIFIEDGGLPDVARMALDHFANDTPEADARTRALVESVRLLTRLNALNGIMPWFAQARDAADGVISWKNGAMFLDWNIAASQPTMDAVVHTHTDLAIRAAGVPLVPLTWTALHDLITPHPLGGARMGASNAFGVVNHMGEVFGYRNLFVTDGAIVPKAIGLNPSRTIAALAERCAKLIADAGR
jgi:cholesterol oxidase